MSEPFEPSPINPMESGPPPDSGFLPPYQPPGVAFTQPVEFVAGTCGKSQPGDPTCADSANGLAS
ncbi:MAG: hypothetical protein MUF10_01075 [Thermoanaerobaculaceae bacterium]|jgi:hypothetical protein|nr:hypothetical protein [Thermoanaerobaculaceae bacterium]